MADNAQSILRRVRELYNNPRLSLEQIADTIQNFNKGRKAEINDQGAGYRTMTPKERTEQFVGGALDNIGGGGMGALGMLAFGNRVSKNLNKSKALKMAKLGATNQEIYNETGLLVPLSGKVAEPLPSSGVLSSEEVVSDLGKTERYQSGLPVVTRLDHVLNNPEYFDRYPELRPIPVVIGDKAKIRPKGTNPNEVGGTFNYGPGSINGGSIWMNKDTGYRRPFESSNWFPDTGRRMSHLDNPHAYSVLEHEALHPTQMVSKIPESLGSIPWEKRIEEIISSGGAVDTPEGMAQSFDDIKRLLGPHYPHPENPLTKFRTIDTAPRFKASKNPFTEIFNRVNDFDEDQLRMLFNWKRPEEFKRGGLVQMKEKSCL